MTNMTLVDGRSYAPLAEVTGGAFTTPFILRAYTRYDLFWALSVDHSMNGGRPINREYDLPKLSANGRTLTDQREMRRHIIMRECEHHRVLRNRHPHAEEIASVGNGNLLANFGFVAWHNGLLFHLQGEPVFSNRYTAVVSWKNGQVSVEEVWFVKEDTAVRVQRRHDLGAEDITSDIAFATTGQPVVRAGAAVPLGHIVEMFYDKRHLISPIRFTLNGTTLFLPNTQLQEGLTRKAVGGPVRIALEAQIDAETIVPLSLKRWVELAERRPGTLDQAARFLQQHGILADSETLRDQATLLRTAKRIDAMFTRALEDSGYRIVDGMGRLSEGDACFINGHVEVYFRKAVYPHNLFVRWRDGSSGAVVYPGKSGREGVTLPGAQRFMLDCLQVEDAVLLDNGGDVRFSYRGHELVRSSEHRPEIRSILALIAAPGCHVGRVSIA